MAYDKKAFLKSVTILCDTAEKENNHILTALDVMGVRHQPFNMLFGDYSFTVDGRDFSLLCAVERKANIEELYGNLTHDRERIEKEFCFASNIANDFTLLLENCSGMSQMETYLVPDYVMRRDGRKVQEIGKECYATIQSWKSGNKYKFDTIFVKDPSLTALRMVEHFYYWWRNFKILSANRRNYKRTGNGGDTACRS